VTLLSLAEKDLFSVVLVGGFAIGIEGGGLAGDGTLSSTCFWPSNLKYSSSLPVLWIRIRMFLGLPDPDRHYFVRILILPSTSKKSKKNFDFYYLLTSFCFFIFELLKSEINLPYLQKVRSKKTLNSFLPVRTNVTYSSVTWDLVSIPLQCVTDQEPNTGIESNCIFLFVN
jgi:hypothetical protein